MHLRQQESTPWIVPSKDQVDFIASRLTGTLHLCKPSEGHLDRLGGERKKEQSDCITSARIEVFGSLGGKQVAFLKPLPTIHALLLRQQRLPVITW